MSTGLSMWRFGFAPCVVALLLSPVTVLAADWYWVNDFGGTWDEEIGGLTSWRDPSDNPGMPAAGDDALLVLPYRDSFCDPGGGCFTQPVVVLYRSDTDPTLSELIIESQNMLVQEEGTGATPDQLNLTSDVEIVGGSDRTFSPPPSFPLPDPPGIFPEGTHIQRAGVNTVNGQLRIGGIAGSTGNYELSDTGVLDVALSEIVGVEGHGSFTQSGGAHTVHSLILGDRADSNGVFDLSGGSLDTDSIVVGDRGHREFIHRSVATTVPGDLVVAREQGSTGRYELQSGELTVLGDTILGESGEGSFIQSGSDSLHRVDLLTMASSPGGVASYELHDGRLDVEWLYLGDDAGCLEPGTAMASFTQLGGEHDVNRLQVGGLRDLYERFVGHYSLSGGELRPQGMSISYDGTFEQSGGLNAVAETFEVLGEYTLLDGRLEVGSPHIPIADARIWVAATFEQVAASSEVWIYGSVDVRGSTYTMMDGSLFLSGDLSLTALDAGGTFTQHDGDVNVDRASLGTFHYPTTSVNLYDMRGGNLVVRDRMTVGQQHDSEVHQTGGTVHVRGDLVVGESSRGRYWLGGGQLEVDGTLDIASADGSFDLGGGRLTLPMHSFLTNRGQLWWGGGEFNSHATISNEGTFTIEVPGSPIAHLFGIDNYGDFNLASDLTLMAAVYNYGTIKLFDGVEVEFYLGVHNFGRLESDPALARFQEDLDVRESGYLVGGTGDRFVVEGDFLNSSEQAELWNTDDATLILSGSGRKVVALPGEDRGDSPASGVDNFAWGALEVLEGVEVEFTDGNVNNDGTALYVGVLDVEDRALIDAENRQVLCFFGDASVYYDRSRPENEYLGGLTYTFAEGHGTLSAQIPEPTTLRLILVALPSIWFVVRRRRTKIAA